MVPHDRVIVSGVCLLTLIVSPVLGQGQSSSSDLPYEESIDSDGDGDEADLARASQNPVGDLISVPFQNNTNFRLGPNERTQNVLNIQPVIPIALSKNWNLITRTILPVLSQPAPGDDRTGGVGDLNFSGFLSPKKPGKVIWGVGPAIVFPTATDQVLGTKKWSIGPSFVALTMHKQWVVGALINNVWSVAGDKDRDDVNSMLMQYFINYNMSDGWYLTSAPIITANWKIEDGKRATIPFGGGFGKIFRLGRQPLNFQMQAFYNVTRPESGARWQLRFSLQLMFPK